MVNVKFISVSWKTTRKHYLFGLWASDVQSLQALHGIFRPAVTRSRSALPSSDSVLFADRMLSQIALLLPNSSLTPQALITILLRLRRGNFNYTSVQLALVHIINGFLGILGVFELNISEAPVQIGRGRSFGLGERDICDFTKGEEGLCQGTKCDALVKASDVDCVL
ncbi:hypothetical protein I7I53_05514 [Histoplasma capsulatum var. duboisii H88]|uniref:Uncharacterized protein n=1 Tax=Ajellomyces capsulatus (strain H88) TaxID=544711 RepID=A0A8A1LX30_AJEC8|nr:hypothetical protein I7I53_05514 [Histoplasma capsulatum var. duboisii H88]